MDPQAQKSQPFMPGGSQASGGFMGGQNMRGFGGQGLFAQQPDSSQPFIPSPQLANDPRAGQVMSAMSQNMDGSGVNINDYGSMWQQAGGADLSGQAAQAAQQQQAQRLQQPGQPQGQQPQSVNPQEMAGSETAPGQGSPFYNYGQTTPTYLPSITAMNQGFAKQAPPNPNMVWGIGNNGGTPGWSYQPGYGGYRG
jgi:hypothetical protein